MVAKSAAGIVRGDGVVEAVDDPHRLARLVRAEWPTLTYYRGEFFRYSAPAYVAVTDDEVGAKIVTTAKAEFDVHGTIDASKVCKVTKSLKANVLENLKALTLRPGTPDMPFWLDGRPGADRLIVCRNGILDLSAVADDPELVVLRPGNPALVTTNALEFDYDPEADCPNWLAFLRSLWPDGDEIPTLQEVVGYLLLPDTAQQKIFMFVGPKRSGKGTIARVLRGLIGPANVCHPILSSLQGDFGLQPLIGKRLAIVGDARLSGRADAAIIVERLLSISGEDPLTINRKFREAVSAQLRTRFVLISNELPRLNDASATLPSRMILLAFRRSFFGEEDHGLTDRLLTERPGILRWALRGLHRLLSRGRFVQPGRSREMLDEMEELSSPATAFVRECCEIAPGVEAPVSDVYRAWAIWCEAKGRKPGSQQSFGRDIRAAVPSLVVTQHRIGGRPVRHYSGLTLTTECANAMLSEAH